LLDTIEEILGLAAADALRYVDQQRGQRRTLRLIRDRDASGDLRLKAFMLAGNTSPGSWLLGLLQSEEPIHGGAHALLAPSAQRSTPCGQRSRQVCACLNVTESEILATLAQCQGSAEERLQQLQAARGCGTQCGSCVPELRRMVRTHAKVA
jgi:assimilatory nitrate reductase catalytic subunit